MLTAQILLVDDNAIQAETRAAILRRSGAKVIVARHGPDALLLLENPEIRKTLRLIVTDHLMPGMNGPELVGHIRATMPLLPVLVLSGMAEAEKEYEHLQVSFHLKPFPPEALIRLSNSMMMGNVLRFA